MEILDRLDAAIGRILHMPPTKEGESPSKKA